MLMFLMNLGVQTAPNSGQVSRDTVRKSGEGCILPGDKTKSLQCGSQGLGMVPKAMGRLSFQAHFVGHMFADRKAAGRGQLNSWALQASESNQALS